MFVGFERKSELSRNHANYDQTYLTSHDPKMRKFDQPEMGNK